MPTKPDSSDQQVTRSHMFPSPTPMRRGSLTERFQKCGKKSCPCHHDPDSRHGPYYSLTRVVRGRTKTLHVPAEDVDVVQRQVEAGHLFRRQLEVYWQECERCADEEVVALRHASALEAEKGGSRRRSRRGSKTRS